jgi:hypothetical protein
MFLCLSCTLMSVRVWVCVFCRWFPCTETCAWLAHLLSWNIRQHTSAYVSIRQHIYVNVRNWRMLTYPDVSWRILICLVHHSLCTQLNSWSTYCCTHVFWLSICQLVTYVTIRQDTSTRETLDEQYQPECSRAKDQDKHALTFLSVFYSLYLSPFLVLLPHRLFLRVFHHPHLPHPIPPSTRLCGCSMSNVDSPMITISDSPVILCGGVGVGGRGCPTFLRQWSSLTWCLKNSVRTKILYYRRLYSVVGPVYRSKCFGQWILPDLG